MCRFDPTRFDLPVKDQRAVSRKRGVMKRTNFIIVAVIAAVIVGIPLISTLFGTSVKNLVIALALAQFAVRLKLIDWKYALKFGLSIWAGFQVMLLMGILFQESVFWTLRAIHAPYFAKVILRA
jgi:hypothetical protein